MARFSEAGVNVEALAAQLQAEGAKAFVKSWNELLAVIASKSNALIDKNTVQLAINPIRTVSIDAVQRAKSGHPGMPMALAPLKQKSQEG